MKGLDKIIERIETESGAECSAVAEAALAETERIKAEYEAKAADAEAEIAERTEREAEAVITRAKSSAAMTRRSVISGERSKNVERAYDKAKESLLSLPRDKYAALLTRLAVAAVKRHTEVAADRRERFGETVDLASFEIVLNARDRADVGEAVLLSMKNNYKKELGADVARRLSLSDSTADIDGGVIVRAGAVEENCSISLMTEALHDTLDGAVYRTLYPEG